jgi:ribosome-associated protein
VTGSRESTELGRIEKLRIVAEAAAEKVAEDAVALDVRGVVSFADTLLILTGRSDRHVRSIAEAIEQAVESHGERPLGIEGLAEARWVLIDLGDLVVHVFQREVRDRYDLERLWSDAQSIDLESGAARRVTR